MPTAAKIASSSVGGSRRTRLVPYFVFQSSLIGASHLLRRYLGALMLHCNMKFAWQYSHAFYNFFSLLGPRTTDMFEAQFADFVKAVRPRGNAVGDRNHPFPVFVV